MVKNLPAMQKIQGEAMALIPGSGRSPGGGHGNTFQYSSYLGSPWTGELATVHGVTQSRTCLK